MTSLDRLAEACGIQPDYYDYLGHYRTVPAQTKRALLAAMGVAAQSEAEANASLEELAARPWLETLRPAIVLRESARPLVPVRLSAVHCHGPISWGIALENGEYREGMVSFRERAPKASREIDGTEYRQYLLQLPLDLEPGYHDFRLRAEDGTLDVSSRLIIAPDTGYGPEEVTRDEHTFGVALQLYSLRSGDNWGVGDLGDLRRLGPALREVGADYIGLNPLHALYPSRPTHSSPYSPSSRVLLNALYIDVTAVPEFEHCHQARDLVASAGFEQELAAARAAEHVDYERVARLKLQVLECMFEYFNVTHVRRGSGRAMAMQRFVAEMGEPLVHQVVYDALAEHFLRQDGHCFGWQQWPAAYREPNAAAVLEFAAEHQTRVRFFEYLQWLLDEQFGLAQQAAVGAGMNVGLYRDLAVGADPGGAEAWGNQDLYCFGASIGAPPDRLALKGQDWGLPPMHPLRLAERGYRDFSGLIRANMRHCGALRIDHVMALTRLWWVPAGGTAADGAYVRYPLDDLLSILALESRRNECIVVGEDLGTVPDEIRGPLHGAGVYSYRVLYFEKTGDGEFLAPAAYRDQAVATPGTHDLPSLWAWWEGLDLQLMDRLQLFPDAEVRRATYHERSLDRNRLLAALRNEDVLPPGWQEAAGEAPADWELIGAILVYLGRAHSALMIVAPEDLLEMRAPVNVPGTVDEYPNWSRKLTATWETWLGDARVRALFDRICQARARATLRRLRP